MAVTTQTYPATPSLPYTAANFASYMESALSDAGFTTWFDSFTDGALEHRVLRIIYDAGKTYGTTYYWFIFSGADMYIHIATGWNISTHKPTGDQYLDYYSNATNTTSFHLRLAVQNASQSLTVTRWTSQERSNFSVFLIRNGTIEYNFFIDPTAPTASLVDLNKVCYTSMFWSRTRIVNRVATVNFQLFPMILRRHFLGAGLRSNTSAGEYGISSSGTSPWEPISSAEARLGGFCYGFTGNAAGSTSFQFSLGLTAVLPVGFTNVNGAYSSDYRPPFTGMRLNAYSPAVLPADFSILGAYTSITLTTASSIIIEAGVEVGQIIAVANGGVLGEGPGAVFYARTT